MRVLLTGANGFVGSHLLETLLRETDYEIVCPVSFAHCGDPIRLTDALRRVSVVRTGHLDLKDLWSRVHVIPSDLSLPPTIYSLKQFGVIDVIANVASASHVDTSIVDPREFVLNNVGLQLTMLEAARYLKPRLFLQMSTDEVHGPAPDDVSYHEYDRHMPGNPYSASKSAQEALTVAYWRTYGVRAVITRTMNLISPYAQDVSKFVPRVIRAVNNGTILQIHGTPEKKSGSRCWIDARDWATAWHFLIEPTDVEPSMFPRADQPDVYHIVGRELSNLDLALLIAKAMDKPLQYEIVDFHSERPGHDVRYSMEDQKFAAIYRANTQWSSTYLRPIERTIANIVDWAWQNPSWYA
jgi:dTDP-glucose 4,6-dehydratase